MTGSVLFTIVLTVLWFITGVRDLMGKDPLINLPFNQYNRDPEYRAFWQKKNGIWELANGITFGLSNVLIVFPEARTARTVVLVIMVIVDVIYVVAYEQWRKRRRYFIMVKHIILWQLKDELSAAEKAEIKANIKTGLEGLAGQIPGLVEVHVNINGLPSSNADLMLDTTFTDAAALKGYSTHPAHVAVADGKVRPYTKTRVCLDFEV